MFSIQEYLKKFSRFAEDSSLQKSIVESALAEATGTEKGAIPFVIRGSTVYLESDPLTKNLVFMHKETILSKLGGLNLKKRITDVR